MKSETKRKLKVTRRKAENIRNLYATGEWTIIMLAKKYRVDISYISKIINRKSHV